MASGNQETFVEMALRIRRTHLPVTPCETVAPLELCRLDLMDAIEKATDFEFPAVQAERIADAVLGLMRQQR